MIQWLGFVLVLVVVVVVAVIVVVAGVVVVVVVVLPLSAPCSILARSSPRLGWAKNRAYVGTPLPGQNRH